MKKFFFLLVVSVISSMVFAQSKPYRILFDITSKDTADQQTVVRHVDGMSKTYPDANLEVVIYGGAITMALKDKSTVAQKIQDITERNKNVSFKVCEGTMRRLQIDKSSLLPYVGTVPDAIIELVTKQGEGWGYI